MGSFIRCDNCSAETDNNSKVKIYVQCFAEGEYRQQEMDICFTCLKDKFPFFKIVDKNIKTAMDKKTAKTEISSSFKEELDKVLKISDDYSQQDDAETMLAPMGIAFS